jgi:transposase-like protein
VVADRSFPEVSPPYPGTWQKFLSWFADEKTCAAYLEQLRWGPGFRCPKCEGAKGWRLIDGRWFCSGCGRKVSVTAGTMLQKLRTATVRPGRDRLCGPVEADETYVGGIAQGVRGRGANCKFIVAVAIEVLSPKGFGRVRLQHVNDVSGASLVPLVLGAVERGSEVRTDGWKGYNGLSPQGYIHHATSIFESRDPAHVSMPGVHKVASFLKPWLLGTHQGAVNAEHLDAYLNEFAFRFNRRYSSRPGSLFRMPTAAHGRYAAHSISPVTLSHSKNKTQPGPVTVLRLLPHFFFYLVRSTRYPTPKRLLLRLRRRYAASAKSADRSA